MKHRYLTGEELSPIAGRYETASVGEGERPALYVGPSDFLALMAYLKEESALAFDHLSCLTAVDTKETIEAVYILFSEKMGAFIEVKVSLLRDAPELPSVTSVFPGAEFEEREVYDLMGVVFTGHPDLRRILMPEDFTGHPLRKDFVYKKPAPPRVTRFTNEREKDV